MNDDAIIEQTHSTSVQKNLHQLHRFPGPRRLNRETMRQKSTGSVDDSQLKSERRRSGVGFAQSGAENAKSRLQNKDIPASRTRPSSAIRKRHPKGWVVARLIASFISGSPHNTYKQRQDRDTASTPSKTCTRGITEELS